MRVQVACRRMVLYRLGANALDPGNSPGWVAAMTDSLSLGGLFAASFLAATLLPGGSEIVLAGVIMRDATLFWPALGVATVGNTLGGMSSYLLGRLLPRLKPGRQFDTAMDWLHRRGSPALLLSWVPIIGDALCVAAGWLRLRWLTVLFFMILGKFARYYILGLMLK
jgi:membrane protein YqaA with SNARE-associated domain